MRRHRQIALVGVGASPKSLAIQGFVREAASGGQTNNIRFSPYLEAWYEPNSSTLAGLEKIRLTSTSFTPFFLVSVESDRFCCLFVFDAVLALTTIFKTIAMTTFFIKRGDTLPRIESTLKYNTGAPIDLTGATSVVLAYKLEDGDDVVTKEGEILNAIQGRVGYQWVDGDTAATGNYQAEWRITFAGDGKLTIPNDDTFIRFKVSPSLSDP